MNSLQFYQEYDPRSSCIFGLENVMEMCATDYFKEKRFVEESLLREDRSRLEGLKREYRRIATYHFERCGQFNNFCYYSI